MAQKYPFLTEQSPAPFENLDFSSLIGIDNSHVLWKDKKMLHFCSKDNLGLSHHADIKKGAMKHLLQFGMRSSYCSLLNRPTGNQIFLEEKLSEGLGTESALLFASFSSAVLSVLTSIINAQSLIFIAESCDPLLHTLASLSKAEVVRFPADDLSQLEDALDLKASQATKLIITESLFRQTGHLCLLDELIAIANQHHCLLLVDDSCAFGLKGVQGMGLAAQRKEIDFVIGSFYGACGMPSAYLGCSKEFRDYIIQAGLFRSEISLSTSLIGAIDSALDYIPQMEGERRQLEHRSHWFTTQLKNLDIPYSSSSHLILIPLGSEAAAYQLWHALSEQQILCELLAPHSLVICINIHHTPEDLNTVIQALQVSTRELSVAVKRY